MKNKIQSMILIFLIACVTGLTVAYASLTSRLIIINKQDVEPAKWQINFSNIDNISSEGNPKITSNPSIDNDTKQKISGFDVSFTSPKQSVSYTFDIKNEGTIDAQISSISNGTKTCRGNDAYANEIVCNEIDYELYYTDTKEAVAIHDKINKGTSKNITVIISFDKDDSLDRIYFTDKVQIDGLETSFDFIQSN